MATKPQSWYRLVMKSVVQPSHVYTVNILTEVEGQVALGRPKLLETIKRRQETGIFIIWKEIKVAATADEPTTAKVTVSTKKCLQNKKVRTGQVWTTSCHFLSNLGLESANIWVRSPSPRLKGTPSALGGTVGRQIKLVWFNSQRFLCRRIKTMQLFYGSQDWCSPFLTLPCTAKSQYMDIGDTGLSEGIQERLDIHTKFGNS